MNADVAPLSQRICLAAGSTAGWALIWSLGTLLRYRVEGWEHFARLNRRGTPVIFSFWHNQIFCATHFWRFREIGVITSQHADGEYMARIIRRFGYFPARGSSRRGSTQALLQLKRHLAGGRAVGFCRRRTRGSRLQGETGAALALHEDGDTHPSVPHPAPAILGGFRLGRVSNPQALLPGPGEDRRAVSGAPRAIRLGLAAQVSGNDGCPQGILRVLPLEPREKAGGLTLTSRWKKNIFQVGISSRASRKLYRPGCTKSLLL